MRRWSNGCSSCGEDFGSVTAFDGHRVGKHGYTYSEGVKMEPMREDGRRCLTRSELAAKGWARDRHLRWRTPGRESLFHDED